MRLPSTWFSLGVGFTGAVLANAINSQSRLMGYSPNEGAENPETGHWESGLSADEKVTTMPTHAIPLFPASLGPPCCHCYGDRLVEREKTRCSNPAVASLPLQPFRSFLPDNAVNFVCL